jgi:ribosomal-protein-alanine N-acetyltransferase
MIIVADLPDPQLTSFGRVITQLRTPRLLIRSLALEDRDEFVRVYRVSEEFFAPWSAYRTGSYDDIFRTEMSKVEMGRRNGTHHRMVGVLEDGRIAGFFSLGEIVRGVFHNAYVGWKVNVEVARQGYATEGVTALLDFAFAREGAALHRIQANVIPTNEPSIRLAEKLGLRREGIAERYLEIAGRWQDHVMFARTLEEHRFTYLTG